jgi:hypothetical protein
MMRDIDQATDRLADVLWWLKGFDAARDGPFSEPNDASSLAEKIRTVREYLVELQDGSIRRLGDEKAVVLTYAEFESVSDALRPGATPADVDLARAAIAKIFQTYGREARASRAGKGLDIPF